MALPCPIRRMNIHVLFLYQAPYIAQALRDSCPRKLLLSIAVAGGYNPHELHALFPPEAAGKLTHLVFFAEVSVDQQQHLKSVDESRRFYWDQLTDSVVDSVKHLRLTHLRLIFHYYTLASEPEPELIQVDSEVGLTQTPRIAHDADLHPTAIRLLDAFRTVQYVFLTICGVRRPCGQPWKYWHSSRAWRRVVPGVDDEDPHPPNSGLNAGSRGSCAVEIGEEVAKAVVNEEELGLEKREEDMVWQCVEFASE